MTVPVASPVEESNALNLIRTATALTRFPVHQLFKGKSSAIEISLKNDDGTLSLQWEVAPNPKFGDPGPLAYKIDTLIVNRRIEEAGNAIPEFIRLGSLREICSELGLGGDTALVRKALLQNATTAIHARLKYRSKDKQRHTFEFASARYGVVFRGDDLPGGKKADAVYIALNPLYRELLAKSETRPLDYNYLKSLKSPVSQRLYELLSFQMFGALEGRRARAKYLYSEFCREAPQKRYHQYKRMHRQMKEVHAPHLESGWIQAVEFVLTTDSEGNFDWEMFYTPGRKAQAEHRVTRRDGQLVLDYGEEGRSGPRRGRPPKSLVAAPVVASPVLAPPVADAGRVERLFAAGVNRADAERLAAEKPEECERQLEYLPFQRDLENPGAFLRAAIEGAYTPPRDYTLARERDEAQRKKRDQAQRKKADEATQEALRAAQTARLTESLSQLEQEAPEAFLAFQAFVEARKAELAAQYGKLPEAISRRMIAQLDMPERRLELFDEWREATRDKPPFLSSPS